LGYFFPQLWLCINFGKNGLGYILGDFFTNSSGHLDHLPNRAKWAEPAFNWDWERKEQGCQIFLGPNIQNWGKYTK
jgi:hypothetical protein